MMEKRLNTGRAGVILTLAFFSLAAMTWAAPLSAQKSGKKKTKKKTKEKTAEVAEEEAEAEAKAAAEAEAKAAAAKEKKEEMNLEAKEQAADLFFEGVILYDQGKFASALEKFTKSYALHRYWKTLYNIGMCYLELNDQPSAASALSQFLDEGSGKIQKEIVESVAATLKKIKAKVGIIRLTGYLEGGMLTIDGVENPRGAAGADVYVTPGVHHVKLTSQNLLLLDKKITIEGGEEKEIFVVEPTEDMIQKAQIIGDEGKKDKGPSQEEIREMEKRKNMKSAGWALFGLTVAFLAAGGAAGGVALARKNDVVNIEKEYDDLYLEDTSTQSDLDVLKKRRDERYDESMNASIASTALFSAAGATGIIFLILLPMGYKKTGIEKQPEPEKKPEADKKIGFDLNIAPDSLGFSLHF